MTIKQKILVVDDDKEFLSLLEEFLVSRGYEVMTSLDGDDAQKRFPEFMPDIVVTDIVMPGVDGIELLLNLRKVNPEVRIITMSGGNAGHASTYLKMADNLGANVILYKPFKLSELLEQINKLEADV